MFCLLTVKFIIKNIRHSAVILLSFPKQLFVDPEEKMDRWIERLTMLRKKKLEGEAMT